MPVTSIDRPSFLANLRQSGLLNEVQMQYVEQHLSGEDKSRRLGRALIELGFLTRFQAERLLAGRVSGFLLGQYRILDQVGRGGMGRVYKAEHQTMNRVVALKVLAPNLVKDSRGLELFLREVRAAAQLVHPNIVHAYDANEVAGRYYLVLEFVDGPNLDQLVRKQGPLEIGLACEYMRQSAMGLAAAHTKGMVHRDIKPANILVQTRGQEGNSSPGLVKISDFGLARLQTGTSTSEWSNTAGTIFMKENTVMGTPDFLSPEQARDLHNTDIRSDLYSLGCTFYYLLTGRVPYPGGTTMDKLIRHSTDIPTPLSSIRPEVPGPVVSIVRRLLAKDPGARFQTPLELMEALGPYAVSGPIPWAPPTPAPLPEVEEPEGPAATMAIAAVDARAPINPAELDFDFSGSNDELSCLVSTVPPEQSLTPMAPSQPEPLVRLANRRRSRPASGTLPKPYPVRKALLIAGAIVAGVLAAFTLLSLVLGGR